MTLLRALLFIVLWQGQATALAANVDGVEIAIEIVAEDVGMPLFLTAPEGDPRLFVVDQAGRILIVKNGEVLEQPFLDISDLVSNGGEQGLLGLAFHPDYASNGRFFVDYTDLNGDTQLISYQVSNDPDVAAADSANAILSIEQPFANHNGGWIAFGPDNYLYIATGDGGSGGDPNGNGQNPDALLGKILRIDVDGDVPYAIPPTNPFAGSGGAPEVIFSGARNPWRASFDGEMLYVADVGQSRFEEVTILNINDDAGANLGWNVMEGPECFRPRSECDQTGLTLPDYAYPRAEGCTIIGGYVYRGKAIPELSGRYFFGDYCVGSIHSFRYADGEVDDLVDITAELGTLGRITSFGVDADGEIYVQYDGTVARIVPGS